MKKDTTHQAHASDSKTKKVQIDHSGRMAVFHHRDTMRTRHTHPKAELPRTVPATPLPVDCTGGGAVKAPMDGNDTYGDCMEATAAHVDQIWTFGRGGNGWAESNFPLDKLEQQYLAAAGGDNGLDEPTLLQHCWAPGIAGIKPATYDDSLDIDVNNLALARYCIDHFSNVCMMWSVPDAFIQGFQPGGSWDSPGVPNPENGHGTPLSDVDAQGRYRLFTWGAWVWVSPTFVKSVDPECWVTFSRRQFNAQGIDARGRTVAQIAQAWVAIGGSADKAAAVVALFSNPAPAPGPAPAAVTLIQAQGWAKDGVRAAHVAPHEHITRAEAEQGAADGLAKRWPA